MSESEIIAEIRAWATNWINIDKSGPAAWLLKITDPSNIDDPGVPPPDVIEAMAKDCKSCGECGEPSPCATCMAGGVCIARCTCHEEPEDDGWIGDYDPLACPGCGGICQVACR